MTNQVPPLAGHSVLATDPALEEGLRRWSTDAAYEDIAVLGELAGRAEAQHAGELANTHTPFPVADPPGSSRPWTDRGVRPLAL